MLKTKLVQLFGGDELVVVIHGGSGGLLQLLCQAVKEGGPAGSRTKRGNVKDLQILICFNKIFISHKESTCILGCSLARKRRPDLG